MVRYIREREVDAIERDIAHSVLYNQIADKVLAKKHKVKLADVLRIRNWMQTRAFGSIEGGQQKAEGPLFIDPEYEAQLLSVG